MRLGLGAFKVLGGSYAVARLLCQKLNLDTDSIDYNYLLSDEVKQRLESLT